MCVLALAHEAHPCWRLVVAANRDERHDRASADLARWEGEPIIAGRDLVAGGTWLAVSEAGRFAAVTNLRESLAPRGDRLSRGYLVVTLAAAKGALAEPPSIVPDGYNAFNAVLVSKTGFVPASSHDIVMAPSPIAKGPSVADYAAAINVGSELRLR